MSKSPPKGSRVAVYGSAASVMWSVSASEPSTAVADQIGLCRLFAESHAWEVVAVYTDEPRSGRAPREGLMQMLHGAARRAFDVLLVRDLDRLGRDAGFVQQLLNMLGAAGVIVGVVQDPQVLCAECALAQHVEEIGDE